MKGLYRTANRWHDVLYMGIRRTVLVCLFLGVIGNTIAQTAVQTSPLSRLNYDVQPLTIGDKVPDITFHNVLNYKSKTAKLSDFQGKLVILDMWSVFCTSCIAGFPKMEKLQKEFGDKIQILLVNPHDDKYDSEEKIKATLNRFKTRTDFYPSLPIPIHDSILNRYFPHQSVPHVIWIDSNGNLIAVTPSVSITVENIKAILAGKEVILPTKKDWVFNSNKPLLVEDNGGKSENFIYRSIFTGYNGEIGYESGLRKNSKEEVIGIYILNASLLNLIDRAYPDIINGTSMCRRVFNVRNLLQYTTEYNPENAFCYDITIPPTQFDSLDISSYLREDLKRFFKVSVHKEKRKLKCLIVTASDKIENSFTKFKTQSSQLDKLSVKKYFHNYPVWQILEFFETNFDKPMIDESGITKHIDIDLPQNFDLSNSAATLAELKKAGFKIKVEEREVEVVVISDKN